MLTVDASVPLLAPDPALPQRDRLLDAAVVVERIARLGLAEVQVDDATIASARLVRAKYRLGESLRTVWRIDAPAGAVTMTARAFAGLAAAADAQASAGRAHLDFDLTALWWAFPDDRRLRCLDRLVAADPAIADALGVPGWATSTVAEYAPERSLTLRADGHDRTPLAYVKAFAPGTVDLGRLEARYRTVADWFDRLDGVRSPRVIATTDDAVLSIEALPGRTWAASGADADTEVLATLGRAIGHLHGLPAQSAASIASPFGRLRPDRLRNSAELVATARPDVATSIRSVADRLELRPAVDDIVFLHGDCHPKNALIDTSGVALIDLDQAGLGDPACDIASLVARLLAGVVAGEHDDREARLLVAAFLSGYGERRPLPPVATLRWYIAAAIVTERAIRSVNRLQAQGLRSLAGVVDLADRLLDGDVLSDAELGAGA